LLNPYSLFLYYAFSSFVWYVDVTALLFMLVSWCLWDIVREMCSSILGKVWRSSPSSNVMEYNVHYGSWS
jgi:hypothetical protein